MMMRKRRLLWQIYPPYLIFTAISLVAVGIYLSISFRRFYIEKTAADLLIRARLLESRFSPLIGKEPSSITDGLCKEVSRRISTRVTVILPSGKVIGDSREDPSKMDNHGDRPEVIDALNGKNGESIRFSYTLRENMMYVALPLQIDGEIRAVLRVSIPLFTISQALAPIYARIIIGAILTALFLALVSYVIARRIRRPIEELRRGAERFARGEFGRKLHLLDYYEMGALAESMNDMAAQLDERIRAIVRQREEMDAILSSMIEGVLAVDPDERVLIMNQAAAGMFEVDSVKTPGLSIQEAVRNIHVHRFVNRTLESSDRVDEEIEAGSGKDSVLRARGTVLRDENGGKVGALIVFTDITDLRRLENIRREFVANVSHELKTPITAIKGFVETLQGGAIADKEEAEKFLGIIARHADRLDAIIDDLLSLSKIEQAGDKEDIKIENAELGQVIKSSIKSLEMKAREKNIGIKFDCPADLRPSINASLIEQAVTNLLDNAINYRDPGNDVEVKAAKMESNIIIAVRDHGCGIERRHLPRLFERFYRVDTARSRKMGGTGLGLAIVKHIAQIHGGYATVESEPGKGSLFSLNLPHR